MPRLGPDSPMSGSPGPMPWSPDGSPDHERGSFKDPNGEWAFVGEGRGSYQVVQQFVYVGEGQGSISFEQACGKQRKWKAMMCLGFYYAVISMVLVCLLVGLVFLVPSVQSMISSALEDTAQCSDGLPSRSARARRQESTAALTIPSPPGLLRGEGGAAATRKWDARPSAAVTWNLMQGVPIGPTSSGTGVATTVRLGARTSRRALRPHQKRNSRTRCPTTALSDTLIGGKPGLARSSASAASMEALAAHQSQRRRRAPGPPIVTGGLAVAGAIGGDEHNETDLVGISKNFFSSVTDDIFKTTSGFGGNPPRGPYDVGSSAEQRLHGGFRAGNPPCETYDVGGSAKQRLYKGCRAGKAEVQLHGGPAVQMAYSAEVLVLRIRQRVPRAGQADTGLSTACDIADCLIHVPYATYAREISDSSSVAAMLAPRSPLNLCIGRVFCLT
eukprot:CAMPEP_0171177138 /NCGR_PEP_ID=MMETSP0790-20130122/12088_1 /TAXON_ID=2925 /ORGANISM="Alexandrium catenella, Strain OF101" /LENGTH=443 /DNA_ID=CAMNT_0011642033 /DNA_START=38 /DNA_END=1368 /DNA_ORIENTATION=+